MRTIYTNTTKNLLPILTIAATLFASATLMFSQAPAGAQGKANASVTPASKGKIKGSDAPYKGKVERIVVHGKALEGNLEGDDPNREALVYLPPSYAAQPNRRYPVLYFLHGYGIGAQDYFNLMTVPQSADAAYAAGAREMIIVLPDAFTIHSGSMYSNSPTIGNWEDFVAEDLVTYMDGHYRTIANRNARGLAGHSMGGYGAFRIGMKFPSVFSSLYPMSSCCLMNSPNGPLGGAVATTGKGKGKAGGGTTPALAAAWSSNPNNPPTYYDLPVENGEYREAIGAKWYANSPLAMVDQYWSNLKKYKAIMIDIGLQDGLIRGNADMTASLKRLGITHAYETYEGDHTNRVRERFQNKVVPFFGQNLEPAR